MKKLFFGTLCLAMLAGCIGPTPKPVAICQDVAGPSLLEQYVPDLKLADGLFKLAVLEVGRLDAVKQKDIAKVLDEAEAMINAGATYDGLVSYLLPKFKFIRDNAGPEVIIVGEYFTNFQGVATPLTPKDVCYLQAHIASQRAKVLPWIRK